MTTNENAYEGLGKYQYEYQRAALFLQLSIQFMLNKYGLQRDIDGKDENIIARIVLTNRSHSDLLNMFIAISAIRYGENSCHFKVAKTVKDFLRNNLLGNRNDLIHAYYYVNEEEIENLLIHRDHYKGKTGFKSLGDLPSSWMDNQTEVMHEINYLLASITFNIEHHDRICGNYNIKNVSISIDENSTKNLVDDCIAKLQMSNS